MPLTRKCFLFIISTFLINIAFAEEIDSVRLQEHIAYQSSLPVDTVARYTDSIAHFPGGYKAFRKFCSDSLVYSKKLAENEITGRVVIQFVVEADGSCTFPIVLRGYYDELDACALKLFRKMPKFTPAYYKGVPVRSLLTYPFYINPLKEDAE